VTTPDPDGFSPFQRGTEIRVRDVLQQRGLTLAERHVVPTPGDGGSFIAARIPGLSAEIWMHLDQTDIVSPNGQLRLEEWDARTPEEHYAKVVQFLQKLPLTPDAS